MQKLFKGKVRNYIRCLQVKYESDREEDFYDLQLCVSGCKDIYDSFRKELQKEVLEGENKYNAGQEHGMQVFFAFAHCMVCVCMASYLTDTSAAAMSNLPAWPSEAPEISDTEPQGDGPAQIISLLHPGC